MDLENRKTRQIKCPAFQAFNHLGQVVPVRCGSWYCQKCMKVNARLWAWRTRLHIKNHPGEYYFITLTLPGKYRTAVQGFEDFPRIWNRIRMWIVRKLMGQEWHYVAFVEGQPKRGHMPHFHIISSVSIQDLARDAARRQKRTRRKARKNPRIKDWAVARQMGFQADEQPVEGPQAGQYVAKYASKQSPETPKGFRRVRTSQGWDKLPDFDGQSLIVKAYNEHLLSYLWRVSDETGVSVDTLHERWTDAQQNLDA